MIEYHSYSFSDLRSTRHHQWRAGDKRNRIHESARSSTGASGEDFAALVDSSRDKNGGKLEKYTITARQVILYFDGLNARQRVDFTYKLRAKFPVRAQTFSSRVYEYYNPTVEDKTKPVEMTVVAK